MQIIIADIIPNVLRFFPHVEVVLYMSIIDSSEDIIDTTIRNICDMKERGSSITYMEFIVESLRSENEMNPSQSRPNVCRCICTL